MEKKKEIKEVFISQFVNANDKKIRHNSFQELIRDGLVTQFCFIYINPKEKKKSKYISTRISKLDLYNKEITTVNGNKFKILNDIEVNPKKAS